MTEWVTVERPGYLGKKRDEICKGWDEKYGKYNWRIAYEWCGQIVDREFALQLYEDGYYEFFREEPDTLMWLVKTASDVFDTAPTNVEAGLSYFKQETPNNHIHDVAIRRAVLRHGLWFEGDHLMHVRWTGSEGFRVNPGIVPFHLPQHILQHDIQDHGGKGLWWRSLTIEDFYQRNKLLQVTKERLDFMARPEVWVPCGTYGCTNPRRDYATFCESCYRDYLDDPDAYK